MANLEAFLRTDGSGPYSYTRNSTLKFFTSLSPERTYFALGFPGSFDGCLFLSSSLHFVHFSYTNLQWLSKVQKEVEDKKSPAWNKGRIFYLNSSHKVVKSYEAQYFKDMEKFLNARAQEIVHGGLMAIIVPACPNGTPHFEVFINKAIELLGCCLMGMAKKGKTSE
ncbi:probable S-adenosylmethionine-dependent methyltransferase At5g38100 [Ziziphus jujuba]|uniref:Probable S-adenosylmethionine-dependent methyltransferase At5g38100 n=1 Tax=Ziziphus jujuba TaxID=326968 RepID=A0ABM3IKV7_ZIZJJ|nr:probable S-adenosylmethionine-dependent methyltransferase At5g38100 [Ziziphus jujuba]